CLDLPDALAADAELLADRLERMRLLAEAEPKLDHAPRDLVHLRQSLRDAHVPGYDDASLGGIDGTLVGEQLAELEPIFAGPPVHGDVRVDLVQRLVDVLRLVAGRFGKLVDRRLPSELDLEPRPRAAELLLALLHVRRNADRVRLVRDRSLARLANPPGRVR